MTPAVYVFAICFREIFEERIMMNLLTVQIALGVLQSNDGELSIHSIYNEANHFFIGPCLPLIKHTIFDSQPVLENQNTQMRTSRAEHLSLFGHPSFVVN